jgi:hypothetical protein
MTDIKERPGQARQGQGSSRTRRARLFLVRTAWCGLGVAAVWAGAVRGLWFAPFMTGALTGLVAKRSAASGRATLTVACLIGLVGWALPIVWLLVEGEPVAATARVVAALAGLPPYSFITISATLLIAALQAAIGTWLGWSAAALVRWR